MRLQFTDILGINKNVEVPRSQFEKALDGEIMFDGSSIEGFVRIEESDMLLKPDLAHLPHPARTTTRAAGWPGCSATSTPRTSSRSPAARAPRSSASSTRAKKLGFAMMAGCEAEFFLFEQAPDGSPTTITHDSAAYFDLGPLDKGEEIRRVIVEQLVEMGFEVEAAHHEVAAGQHEIDFRYADALITADNLTTFKFVVRNVANRYGYIASFMPKPIQGINGSGMHTHQSLFRGKDNAFFDPKAEYQLSRTRAELHRGPAAARARLLRDHQPADQQLQAAGAGLRGAGQRGLVHAQPLAAGAHSRPARARHPLRAPDAGSVLQSRTSRSRSSSRPGSTASSGSSRPGSRSTATSSP